VHDDVAADQDGGGQSDVEKIFFQTYPRTEQFGEVCGEATNSSPNGVEDSNIRQPVWIALARNASGAGLPTDVFHLHS